MAEALAWRLRAQATFVPESRPGDVMLEAAAAIETVLALHAPRMVTTGEYEGGLMCNECDTFPYPCPTVDALN